MSKITEGQVFQNVCCQGYTWKVAAISAEIWGICDNPNCPIEKDNNFWRGVSHFCEEDLSNE